MLFALGLVLSVPTLTVLDQTTKPGEALTPAPTTTDPGEAHNTHAQDMRTMVLENYGRQEAGRTSLAPSYSPPRMQRFGRAPAIPYSEAPVAGHIMDLA